MAIFYGQLEKAQLENLAVEPATAPLGYVYHDTVSDCAKVKTSDGFKKLLGVAGSAKIMSAASAPNAGGGLAAPVASLALVESNGAVYVKVGAGALEWEQLKSDALALRTTGGVMTGDIDLSGTAKIKAGSLAGYLFAGETTLNGFVGSSSPIETFTPNANTKALMIELLGPGGSYTHTHAAVNNTISVSGAAGGGAYAKILLKNSASHSVQYTFNMAYTRLTLGAYHIQANSGAASAALASTGLLGITLPSVVSYTVREVSGGIGGTISSGGSTPADLSILSQQVGTPGSTAVFRYEPSARYNGTAWDMASIYFIGGEGGCNATLGVPVNPNNRWAQASIGGATPGKICDNTNTLYAGIGQGAQPTGVLMNGAVGGAVTIVSYGGQGRIRITELI